MITYQWQPKEGVAEISDDHPYYTPDELEQVAVEVPDPEESASEAERIAALEATVASLVSTLSLQGVTISEDSHSSADV